MIIDSIAFRNLLGQGEEIKYVAHVHPFIVYPELFKVILFGIVMPLGAYFLFPPFIAIWAVWAGMGTILFIYRVLQWYLDAWIVTNLAVIDQNWDGIFNRSTTRIEHGHTEGVSTEIKGFWGTIMNFGNIQIEHMSGAPVVLESVARPRKLERMIVLNQQEFMRKRNFEDHGKLKDMLINLLRSDDSRA